MDYSSFISMLIRARAYANSFLSQYEPLALVSAPLFALFVAWIIQSLIHVVADKGVKATIIGLFTSFIK